VAAAAHARGGGRRDAGLSRRRGSGARGCKRDAARARRRPACSGFARSAAPSPSEETIGSITAAAGAALLLLLAVDVFQTVFSPHGRGGPVNRRQNRLSWRFFQALGRRRDGTVRDGWLAVAGPLMVVSTIAIWMLWLVAGFALVYFPWIDTFLASPGAVRTPWAEALYYSGYTASTLGLGDLVADHEALRLLTPVQAAGGFALVSVGVTYFLAVYREVVAAQSLAADVAALTAAGKADLARLAGAGPEDALARWAERFASGLSSVLLAHFQYPVLHYFRSPLPSRSLAVQVGALLELLDALGAAEVPRDGDGVHPSFRALRHALAEYLSEVDAHFVPGGRAEPRGGSTARDEMGAAHRRLRGYMLYG
jgi:hypothetical protein